MKNIIIIIILGIILGLLSLAYSGANLRANNAETRLEACRSLTLDIDNLLAETDNDYTTFTETWYDYLDENISETKALNSLSPLVDNRERRSFLYTNSIDKYNPLCFEL